MARFLEPVAAGSDVMLVNTRTGAVLAERVEVANTRATRRKGLLGRDSLARGSALVITFCNAVHTIGMRFAIDVVFVDRNGTVRRIARDLEPWRLAVSPFAAVAIEWERGNLPPDGVRVNDQLCLSPATTLTR